jgi:endonuclease/exonuclease/phosphatase family metal-dependent hydrolase
LVALQEVVKTGQADTARDLLDPRYHLAHQQSGLVPDGTCIAIASRWPIGRIDEVDHQPTRRTAGFPASTLIAEIESPAPIGRLLFVNHGPAWRPEHELEREIQTVAAARRIEETVADRGPAHVVLAGDLNAFPEAASIRFLRGLQSLDSTSVCYRDSWAVAHPGEPGHTFAPASNPLVMEDNDMRIDVDRRIDYVFVRYDERGPSLDVARCELAFAEPVDGIWASDHYGVVADLEPPTRG